MLKTSPWRSAAGAARPAPSTPLSATCAAVELVLRSSTRPLAASRVSRSATRETAASRMRTSACSSRPKTSSSASKGSAPPSLSSPSALRRSTTTRPMQAGGAAGAAGAAAELDEEEEELDEEEELELELELEDAMEREIRNKLVAKWLPRTNDRLLQEPGTRYCYAD